MQSSHKAGVEEPERHADIETAGAMAESTKNTGVEIVSVSCEASDKRNSEAPGALSQLNQLNFPSWVQTVLAGLSEASKKWLNSEERPLPPIPAASAEDLCPICYTYEATFCPPCGHKLCTRCAVHYLRDALGDAQTQVFPQGVRCPMHSSGCESFITSSEAERLLSERDARYVPAFLALRGVFSDATSSFSVHAPSPRSDRSTCYPGNRARLHAIDEHSF